MKNTIKIISFDGQTMEYNPNDKSLTINGKTFDSKFMERANEDMKGINRIHKPVGLLFWIDCKNGKYSSWIK